MPILQQLLSLFSQRKGGAAAGESILSRAGALVAELRALARELEIHAQKVPYEHFGPAIMRVAEEVRRIAEQLAPALDAQPDGLPPEARPPRPAHNAWQRLANDLAQIGRAAVRARELAIAALDERPELAPRLTTAADRLNALAEVVRGLTLRLDPFALD